MYIRATESKETFIEALSVKRIPFYQANSRLIRLIAWQSLDQPDNILTETTKAYLDKTTDMIQNLQQKNKISSSLIPQPYYC